METFRILSIILQCAIMTKGEDTTVVNLSEELAALSKSERQEISAQGKDKPILRYGFQKTDLCMDYERAFLCVRKCLDFGFDVAYADKRCKCTCFHKKEKAKYTPLWTKNQTNYKLGTPTTKLPAWAQPPTPEPPKALHDKQPEDAPKKGDDIESHTNKTEDYDDDGENKENNSTKHDDNDNQDDENENNDEKSAENANSGENANGEENANEENANGDENANGEENANGDENANGEDDANGGDNANEENKEKEEET